MVDKTRKVVGSLVAAGNLRPNEHTVSNVYTGPEIPGHKPKRRITTKYVEEAQKSALNEYNQMSNAERAADPRTSSQIVSDLTEKYLRRL